jgi:hypothetical protein
MQARHAAGYNSGMKSLLRKPLLLAVLLSIPLWIVFGNYIVAITTAVLVSLLGTMCMQLYTLSKKDKSSPPRDQP